MWNPAPSCCSVTPEWTLTLSPDYIGGDDFISGSLTLSRSQIEPVASVHLVRESDSEAFGYIPPPDTATSKQDAVLAAQYPNLRILQTDQGWLFPYGEPEEGRYLFDAPVPADGVRFVNNRLYFLRDGLFFSRSLDGGAPVYVPNTIDRKTYRFGELIGADDRYLYCRMYPVFWLETTNGLIVKVPLFFTLSIDAQPSVTTTLDGCARFDPIPEEKSPSS